MKKLIHLIFALVVFAGNFIYARTPKIYAVVVGVATYKDNTIPSLKYSEKDARNFDDFLKSSYAGAVPNENISLLIGINATRENIITSLVNMSKRCTKDDMVIFYFSGHGEADEGDNRGYLLGYDALSNNAPATAISMGEINDRLSKCQAKLKVAYIDACHAGMFSSSGKGNMNADNEIIAGSFMQSIANAGDGYVAFLSSSAKQQSQESDNFKNGVFTYYLLKGLEGDADKYQQSATGYNDGLVTVGEMVTYLTDKIPAATNYNQKPTVQGVYDEDFPLSILSPNVQITDAIAKRPETGTSSSGALPNQMNEVPKDENLSSKEIKRGYGCNGKVTFINNSKYNLYLFKVSEKNKISNTSGGILIPSGKTMAVSNIDFGNTYPEDCRNSYGDFRFFFTINDVGVSKYAVFNAILQGGKNKYFILDNNNLSVQLDTILKEDSPYINTYDSKLYPNSH